MITTRSPFSSAEFLRTVNYIPFDDASESERQRWDEQQARFRFQFLDHHKSVKTARMILGVLAVSVCMWAAAIAWLL